MLSGRRRFGHVRDIAGNIIRVATQAEEDERPGGDFNGGTITEDLVVSNAALDVRDDADVSVFRVDPATFEMTVTNIDATGQIAVEADDNLLASDPVLLVRDGDGQPIFQVRKDGSVHIKTGTSIVADL